MTLVKENRGRTMEDLTPLEFMKVLRARIINEAAESAAYEKWSDAFARNTIRAAWNGTPPVGTKVTRRLTLDDIRSVGREDLYDMGFGNWNGDLILIPLWVWNFIADGTELSSINHTNKIKGEDDIDLDNRGGCLAWGVYH